MKTWDHLCKFVPAVAAVALLLGTVCDPSATSRTPVQTRPDTITSAAFGSWSIQRVDFVSVHDGWIVASSSKGLGALFVTRDGGQHWSLRHTWPSGGAIDIEGTVRRMDGAPLALSFANPQDGMAVWDAMGLGSGMWINVARTTDGGRHWHVQSALRFTAPDTFRGLFINDGPLSIVMTSLASAWIASGSLLDPSTTILQTVDGGVHWHHGLATPLLKADDYDVGASSLQVLRHGEATLLTVLNLPHNHLAIVRQRTTNGGQHWQSLSLPMRGIPSAAEIGSAAYQSPADQWIVASLANGTYRLFTYQPDRRAWQPVTLPKALRTKGTYTTYTYPPQITLGPEGVAYVTNGFAIWQTLNQGVSWNRLGRLP